MVNKIYDRVTRWATFAVLAVEDFESASVQRVDFDWDGDADVDFAGVLWAFTSAVMSHVPGVGKGLGVLEQSADLLGMLRDRFGDEYLGESGAKKRLERAVTDLKLAAGETILDSVKGSDVRVRATLDPENEDSPLTGIDWGSTDADYVAELCDWLGVPEPTKENTTSPIRETLDRAFDAVLDSVVRQLAREEGYDL